MIQFNAVVLEALAVYRIWSRGCKGEASCRCSPLDRAGVPYFATQVTTYYAVDESINRLILTVLYLE